MKLYEFSYTDNLNQDESQVLRRVAEFLDLEGDEQGWAPDYSFHQCRSLEQLPNGDRRYHFEVLGECQASGGTIDAEPQSESAPVSSNLAASADHGSEVVRRGNV